MIQHDATECHLILKDEIDKDWMASSGSDNKFMTISS